MLDEVYEYLSNFGFSNELLDKIEDENELIFYANENNVKSNIEFLANKGLTKEDLDYVSIITTNGIDALKKK